MESLQKRRENDKFLKRTIVEERNGESAPNPQTISRCAQFVQHLLDHPLRASFQRGDVAGQLRPFKRDMTWMWSLPTLRQSKCEANQTTQVSGCLDPESNLTPWVSKHPYKTGSPEFWGGSPLVLRQLITFCFSRVVGSRCSVLFFPQVVAGSRSRFFFLFSWDEIC